MTNLQNNAVTLAMAIKRFGMAACRTDDRRYSVMSVDKIPIIWTVQIPCAGDACRRLKASRPFRRVGNVDPIPPHWKMKKPLKDTAEPVTEASSSHGILKVYPPRRAPPRWLTACQPKHSGKIVPNDVGWCPIFLSKHNYRAKPRVPD